MFWRGQNILSVRNLNEKIIMWRKKSSRVRDLKKYIIKYVQLVSHKSEVYEHNMKELELLKDQLDEENLDPDGTNDSAIKIV